MTGEISSASTLLSVCLRMRVHFFVYNTHICECLSAEKGDGMDGWPLRALVTLGYNNFHEQRLFLHFMFTTASKIHAFMYFISSCFILCYFKHLLSAHEQEESSSGAVVLANPEHCHLLRVCIMCLCPSFPALRK